MSSVIISQGDNPENTLKKGLALYEEKSGVIPKSRKVLILCDCQIPQGYPASVNPDTLASLISYLVNRDISEIYVLAGSMINFDPIKNLQALGLDSFITSKGAKIIEYHQLYHSSLKQSQISTDKDENIKSAVINDIPLINQIDQIIILAQIKTDPLISLSSSLPLLKFLIEPEKRITEKGVLKSWIDLSFQVLLEKKPTLFINDCFNVLDGNGPFLWKSPHSQKIGTILISSNAALLDKETHFYLGMNPEENPFIAKANELDIIPRKHKIYSTDQDKKKGKKDSNKKNSIKLPEKNLKNIYVPKLKLYLGELDTDLQYSLTLFLYSLQILFIKDGYNLEDWAIIAGKNPKLPILSGKEYLIVFGDATINSTKNSEFRSISKKKLSEPFEFMGIKFGDNTLLKGEKLEWEIGQKQRLIRRKMEKKRSLYEIIISDLKNNISSIENDKNILGNELKLELSNANYRFKIEQCKLHINNKYEIMEFKHRIPDSVMNKKIIDIPGNVPLLWDALYYLNISLKKSLIPTLNLNINAYENLYHFPTINKKIKKSQWKELNNNLKKKIKEKKATLIPDIKKKIHILQYDEKISIQLMKDELDENKKRIMAKYNPLIKEKKDLLKIEKKKILNSKKNKLKLSQNKIIYHNSDEKNDKLSSQEGENLNE